MQRTKANPNFQNKQKAIGLSRKAKKEHYENMAVKNTERAIETHEQAQKMASIIPFGQPILVGHHSEKSDRRYRARITKKFEKSFEQTQKAEYYNDKAASSGKGGIMSDDPEAVIKLKEKIHALEKTRNEYKAINKIVGSKKLTHDEKVKKLMLSITISEISAKKLLEPEYGRMGIPSYKLTNLGATLRKAKERLNYMIKEESRENFNHKFDNGIEVKEENGRINIYFGYKPDEEIRNIIKHHPFGFKWSRFNECWTRKKTETMGHFFFTVLRNYSKKI